MLDFLNIQSYAADQLRAVFALDSSLAGLSVIEDRGYSETETERALRDQGFCVVVRMPLNLQPIASNGKSLGTATLIVHLMENPEENQKAAALGLNMQQMVSATCSAIQAIDSDGVRCFQVNGVALVAHDPATLVYEITATVPTTGF